MKAASLSHITLLSASLFLSGGCIDKISAPNNFCGVTRRASSQPLEHDPILFVHGYGENADFFCPMVDRFRVDGWAEHGMYAYNYSFVLSHAGNAEEIRKQIDKILADTKASRVDIIAHSAGSVSSRYYLKNLAGTSKVDAWVSLAGPNHGTETAVNCSLTPCIEIRTGSQFLADLNSGDETPGLVRYGTWWSPCDETINPDSSVPLVGATNHQSACISHTELLRDPTVYQQVRDWIDF